MMVKWTFDQRWSRGFALPRLVMTTPTPRQGRGPCTFCLRPPSPGPRSHQASLLTIRTSVSLRRPPGEVVDVDLRHGISTIVAALRVPAWIIIYHPSVVMTKDEDDGSRRLRH